MNQISVRAQSVHMRLNTGKSALMLCSRSKRTPLIRAVTTNGQCMCHYCYQYHPILEVTLTTSLKWDNSLDNLAHKLNSGRYFIVALRRTRIEERSWSSSALYIHPPRPGICPSGLAPRPLQTRLQPTRESPTSLWAGSSLFSTTFRPCVPAVSPNYML